MSCVTALGQAPWELAFGFLQTLSYVPLPLLILLYIPFTVINLSCEYNYILSRIIPPSKSPNLGLTLRLLLFLRGDIRRVASRYPWGIGARTPMDPQILGCSSSFYKMV